jgi:hypothetical protein
MAEWWPFSVHENHILPNSKTIHVGLLVLMHYQYTFGALSSRVINFLLGSKMAIWQPF